MYFNFWPMILPPKNMQVSIRSQRNDVATGGGTNSHRNVDGNNSHRSDIDTGVDSIEIFGNYSNEKCLRNIPVIMPYLRHIVYLFYLLDNAQTSVQSMACM